MNIRKTLVERKTLQHAPLGQEEDIFTALKNVYKEKLLPIEEASLYNEFHSPKIDDADFYAKPMVLVVGQYSTGKTTFIRYLLEKDFPGIRISPEPTTDRFIALMYGKNEVVIPGNALVVDPSRHFRPLSRFGIGFLNRFQCSVVDSAILQQITLVDTPGILSGEKNRLNRGYDFAGVLEWFAERSHRIILLFDANKLDISDELKRAIEAIKAYEDKIQIALNKADILDYEQLLRVYGALMWYLGKVINTPEVTRVYIGSFWDRPMKNTESRRLFEKEENDLISDLKELPKNDAIQKLNDLLKRARHVRVHALIIMAIKEQMPMLFYKDSKKKEILANFPGIIKSVKKKHRLTISDFPDLANVKAQLIDTDFNKFKYISDSVIANNIESLITTLSKIYGTALPKPKAISFRKSSGSEKHSNTNPFLLSFMEEKFDTKHYEKIFRTLPVKNGRMKSYDAKLYMLKSKLPSTVLTKIWILSDLDEDGYLDQHEFVIANYLMDLKIRGESLPKTLPDFLLAKKGMSIESSSEDDSSSDDYPKTR